MKAGIYRITEADTNRHYIGQSQDVLTRLKLQQHLLKRGSHYNPHLQDAYNQNSQNFVFELVAYCQDNELDALEKFHIEQFQALYPRGFNLAPAMSKQKPIDKALATLGSLNRTELLRVRDVIDRLLEVESENSQDDSQDAEQDAQRGYTELKMIPRGDKEYGPYKYLRFWENGVYRSVYLGKADKD